MTGVTPYKTLVLGVGNLLLSDEGVGIRVVERLQACFDLPDEVQVLDGGTLGMDLLFYLEDVRRLLLVDAVETGQEPGTIIRLEQEEVPAFLAQKISPHQMGVPDMLAAAKLRDLYPATVVLWGIQPESFEIGLDLSPQLAGRLDFLTEQVAGELEGWGITLRRRNS